MCLLQVLPYVAEWVLRPIPHEPLHCKVLLLHEIKPALQIFRNFSFIRIHLQIEGSIFLEDCCIELSSGFKDTLICPLADNHILSFLLQSLVEQLQLKSDISNGFIYVLFHHDDIGLYLFTDFIQIPSLHFIHILNGCIKSLSISVEFSF